MLPSLVSSPLCAPSKILSFGLNNLLAFPAFRTTIVPPPRASSLSHVRPQHTKTSGIPAQPQALLCNTHDTYRQTQVPDPLPDQSLPPLHLLGWVDAQLAAARLRLLRRRLIRDRPLPVLIFLSQTTNSNRPRESAANMSHKHSDPYAGSDPEKVGFEHADNLANSVTGSHDVDDIDGGFTKEEQRAIIRRVDRRLVVTVGAMYCVSLMDRTNLSAAAIAGMTVELKLMLENRYNIASLLFFIPYIIFQPPSTIIVRKIGPRLHLGGLTLLWGAVMIGMGFARTYSHLYACRILLGILEAGFFPSCVYLLSTWYTRYEVGKRYSVFYLLGCVASAFAGILAYGLMQLNGREGLTGWRWIFIIEGVLTCALGVAGYWLLVDFPDSKRKSWNFLGERERAWVVARVNRDRGDAHMPAFNLKRFLSAGTDWKIWAYAMIFFNTTTVSYALAYFLPIILQVNMGFSVAKAQCLIAPPYAFAGIVMYATAWLGDKYKFRGPVILINMLFLIVGLPIMGFHPSSGVRYFGVFLTTAGANSNIPAVMAYQANNIRGQWKRAFCSATLVSFGGIGGIAGSLLFREQDKPHYRPGMYACIACSLLTMILVGLLSLDFKRQNGKADRNEKELEASDEGAQPGFRYTY